MNKYSKKTKIIATLGPASSTKETMLDLVKAGTDVFRINFSHADYDLVKRNVKLIREINKEFGYSVGILGDLQGPKLRIGIVEDGSYLNPGDILTFTNENIEQGPSYTGTTTPFAGQFPSMLLNASGKPLLFYRSWENWIRYFSRE